MIHEDINGRPICPGDLLRTFHYTGARKKKHFLYHVAVWRGNHMYAVPARSLEPSMAHEGGECLVSSMCEGTEIISGVGPSPYLSFEDRPHTNKPKLAL